MHRLGRQGAQHARGAGSLRDQEHTPVAGPEVAQAGGAEKIPCRLGKPGCHVEVAAGAVDQTVELVHAAVDLLHELAGVGGRDLPLDVSAIDSFPSATDAPQRSLTVVARQEVSLAEILEGEEMLCDAFDRCMAVSRYLLSAAESWL